MKKLGILLVLLSVGSFMAGCGEKKTPEPAKSAPEGSDTNGAGSAPADPGTPASAPEGE